MEVNLSQTYSYFDYLQFKFEGYVELIKGKIWKMSLAPDFLHQDTSSNLHREIAYFLKNKRCKVISAPFDVRLLDKQNSRDDKQIFTVVQPDICVICDMTKIDRRGCLGA